MSELAYGAESERQFEELVLEAWISFNRCERGDYLHAQQHLGAAIDALLRLLRVHAAHAGYGAISLIAPRRRLHQSAPQLARELVTILLGVVDVPEARLLEIAEARLREHAPGLRWRDLAAVRQRMQT